MADDKGALLWFTGLGRRQDHDLPAGRGQLGRGSRVEVLDGDVVRENLSKGSASPEDRDTNIRRIAFVADLLSATAYR